MRFNATLNVDFTKWTQVKMERENNMKEYKGVEEEMPKFGAGSEFGRDAREEARRKKYGITSKKYKPEDQPWILKSGGKTGKKFKGIREGGISENAAYYVFTHAADGAIEAFPLHEWYICGTVDYFISNYSRSFINFYFIGITFSQFKDTKPSALKKQSRNLVVGTRWWIISHWCYARDWGMMKMVQTMRN